MTTRTTRTTRTTNLCKTCSYRVMCELKKKYISTESQKMILKIVESVMKKQPFKILTDNVMVFIEYHGNFIYDELCHKEIAFSNLLRSTPETPYTWMLNTHYNGEIGAIHCNILNKHLDNIYKEWREKNVKI